MDKKDLPTLEQFVNGIDDDVGPDLFIQLQRIFILGRRCLESGIETVEQYDEALEFKERAEKAVLWFRHYRTEAGNEPGDMSSIERGFRDELKNHVYISYSDLYTK